MNFKKLRTKKMMTQVEVAKAIGVSVATYRLWENGGSKPNYQNLRKICDFFNIKESIFDDLTEVDRS